MSRATPSGLMERFRFYVLSPIISVLHPFPCRVWSNVQGEQVGHDPSQPRLSPTAQESPPASRRKIIRCCVWLWHVDIENLRKMPNSEDIWTRQRGLCLWEYILSTRPSQREWIHCVDLTELAVSMWTNLNRDPPRWIPIIGESKHSATAQLKANIKSMLVKCNHSQEEVI